MGKGPGPKVSETLRIQNWSSSKIPMPSLEEAFSGKYLEDAINLRDCVLSGLPPFWPDPVEVFAPIADCITSKDVRSIMGGRHQAIIRFRNGYGVKVFRYLDSKIFELIVLRFRGPAINDYELAGDTPVPDLSLAFTNEDILGVCKEVSVLE
jgi:hypothetical protein